MNQITLKKYFETALTIADEGKVKRLFASLGYRDYQKITPEMCIQALNAHGDKFSQPFGTLAKSALSTPKVESFIAAHGIDLLTGVDVPTATTAPAVTQVASGGTKPSSGSSGLSLFNSISNFLIDGVKSASDLINTVKGRDMLLAEATLEQQKANTAAVTKTTNWVAIFGIAAVLVVVIVGVVLFKKYK